MKALVRYAAFVALVLGCASVAVAAPRDDIYSLKPYSSPDARKLPRISVSGNRFVDPSGKPMLFRGLNIADPDKLMQQGHWNRELFVKVKEMGANLVRLPVHPRAWHGPRGAAAEMALLDQAVDWCTELNIYVIIDWHSIGNLKSGMFENAMYETTVPETFGFWRTISKHFAGANTVAFYELFNEPSTANGDFGRVTWEQWKDLNEEMIVIIRAHDAEAIPLVAGLDWAYDLTPLRINPIAATNIGYVTHPYAHKRGKPWEPKWEEDFGFAASRYPIIATEIGFAKTQEGGWADSEYGNAITKYLESHGMSWTAWCFDAEWGPTLIRSWDGYTLTESGEFFKQAMQVNNPK